MQLTPTTFSSADSQIDCVATVIILTYNQERTVARAIESVLRQKCDRRFEILIADDGSTDGTRAIATEYAVRYPGVVRMMPKAANKGIVDNYFDAVAAARGKYVADCAGDDEWLDEHRLQAQIEALHFDQRLSAVCCDVESYVTASGEKQIMRGSIFRDASHRHPVTVKGRVVLHALLDHTKALPFVLSSALYRRQPIVDVLENNPRILRCKDGGVEDVPLIAALGSAGDVMHLPIVGYRYYIDGESLSNNLSFQKEYAFVARIVRLVRRLGDHYGFAPQEQRAFFRDKFNYLAALADRIGDPSLTTDIRESRKEWSMPLPGRARLHLLRLRLRSLLK